MRRLRDGRRPVPLCARQHHGQCAHRLRLGPRAQQPGEPPRLPDCDHLGPHFESDARAVGPAQREDLLRLGRHHAARLEPEDGRAGGHRRGAHQEDHRYAVLIGPDALRHFVHRPVCAALQNEDPGAAAPVQRGAPSQLGGHLSAAALPILHRGRRPGRHVGYDDRRQAGQVRDNLLRLRLRRRAGLHRRPLRTGQHARVRAARAELHERRRGRLHPHTPLPRRLLRGI
mmetsp:Transcript_39193/g.86160  ORF Transcript_39193/g.86160 Transcript_39193/m.86160 type:complete len:229 (+) Transcript_39193:376-1062(+)